MKRNLITISILIAILLNSGCERKQFVKEYKSRWIKIKHTPLEKVKITDKAMIEADIEVSGNVRSVEAYLYYRIPPAALPETIEMQRANGHYFAEIPIQRRGTRVEYFIEARGDNDLALRIPSVNKGFQLTFRGSPQSSLLAAHAVLMIISVAFFISSGLLAVRSIRRRKTTPAMARAGFIGLVLFFISAIPVGMIIAYQTFGKPWSGFPIGEDMTDNKSLAIIIYFILASILYRGSLFKNDPNLDKLPIRAMPLVYLIGAIATLTLFALPH